MKEKRDLYDVNKKLTGDFIYKGELVPTGKYYLTVMVWIENSQGEVFLQFTSKKKKNKWSTTGGHPKSGESSMEGIITEIDEEIGIKVSAQELTLFKTIQTEDDFVDVYYMKKDFDAKDCILQEEEVLAVGWFTHSQIEEKISTEEFMNDHIEFYKYFCEYLNTQ